MAILNAIGGCEYTLNIIPGCMFVNTSDTYAQIQTTGYLNSVTPTGVGFVPWSPGFMDGQFVWVHTTDMLDVLMKVYIDGSANINLVPFAPVLDRVFSTPNFSDVTTASQISTTREAVVSYSFSATVNAGESVTANLHYADDSGMSTNLVFADSFVISNSGAVGLVQVGSLKLNAIIPAGKYRQVTFSVGGGATAPSTIISSQEVLI